MSVIVIFGSWYFFNWLKKLLWLFNILLYEIFIFLVEDEHTTQIKNMLTFTYA